MKRKQTSRFISLLLGIVMIFSMGPTVFAADYNDVEDNTWYRTAVDYVTEKNLMASTRRGSFEPETPMTRAMLITVLYRIEGSPVVSSNRGFSDVPDNSYYTAAVAWAAENQISAGVGNGKFSPHSLITRQQFATILYGYANVKGYDTSAYAEFDGYFDTSQISSYAEAAMHWATGSQILRGSGGRLTPYGYVTRVQAALMFMRFMENIAEEPVTPTAPAQPEEDEMIPMNITVGNTTFNAKMYDNETTQALIAQLPLTVNMSELDGKEKFYHFPSNLPVGLTEMPATIHAGEIMLWSSNSLVLFYNTFSNSYGGYVKLGYIENISGLTSALGRGSVQVTFSLGN